MRKQEERANQKITTEFAPQSALCNLLGCRRGWYRAAAAVLAADAPKHGARALDLCCGAGELTFRMCETGRFAVVLGLDFDEQLLEPAKIRAIASEGRGQAAPIFICAPMRIFPIADAEVDVVASAFGPGTDAERCNALSEALRVMRVGATICILDYCRPESGIRRLMCRLQFMIDALLQRGTARDAWRGRFEARLHAPSVQERTQDLLKAGFEAVQTHRFVFGDAVLLWAKKPCESDRSAASEV